jgi:hypothetical protein
MMKSLLGCCLLFIVFNLLLTSCKKDSFITSSNANLNISADSIKFDTVFTSAGSVTKSFKIFNENNQKLLLSKVKLMGGSTSSFKININGNPAVEEDNIEIPANDSIYVFVSVFVNPTTANLPFILSDSILINYNGNNEYVQLEAYGQNAHFLQNVLLSGNHIWQNDLPYVIQGSIRVDTTASLIIEAGCKIYSHADAPFLVDGTLIINGNKSNEVIFSGDRLDDYYKDLPGSWPGIYFRGSSIDNIITFAIIKNANQAVVAEDASTNSNPKLIMHQCIIDNAFEVGLFGFNSSVQADNSLITNCGNNLVIQFGGNYSFTNCTLACYSNTYLVHTNPVLQVSDATVQNGTSSTDDLDAAFVNCIFWGDYGDVDDEVVVDKAGNGIFNVSLENCLYKAINDPANTTLTSVIKNMDPSFDSVDISNKYYDFRITKNAAAPGIDAGIMVAFPNDLDNNARVVGLPDLGSYEKQ